MVHSGNLHQITPFELMYMAYIFYSWKVNKNEILKPPY